MRQLVAHRLSEAQLALPVRIAVDLDDTVLHNSHTCPGLWDLGRGYGDPAILPGYRYDALTIGWRGRLHLLRGRPRYDAVDREAHPFMRNPRVIVAPNSPVLSVLAWAKGQGAELALVTASARARVDYLFQRLPILGELFGDRMMAAEDLAARAVEAEAGPADAETDLWRGSAAAHAARPLSIAAKTPWAVAPIFGGAGYDLLVDDSQATADLMQAGGLGDRLMKIPSDAFRPTEAWGVALDLMAHLTGQNLTAEARAEAIRTAPEPDLLRLEDPLYLPLMHVTDQFSLEAARG